MRGIFCGVLTVLTLASCGIEIGGPRNDTQSAGIAGTWTARNVTNTTGGIAHTCTSGEITIVQTFTTGSTSEGTLTINPRTFSCANAAYQVTWGALNFTFKDEKVYLNNNLVGELTTTSLNVEFFTSFQNTQKFSIIQSGTTYQYQESKTGSSTTTATVEK